MKFNCYRVLERFFNKSTSYEQHCETQTEDHIVKNIPIALSGHLYSQWPCHLRLHYSKTFSTKNDAVYQAKVCQDETQPSVCIANLAKGSLCSSLQNKSARNFHLSLNLQ